jgi:hypothetical protein
MFEIIKTAHAASTPLTNKFAFGGLNSLGEGIGRLIPPAFSLAAVALVLYILIGGFKYMTSGGDKNAVASARAMITHAIIGIALLIMLFLILAILPQLLGFRTSYSIIKL